MIAYHSETLHGVRYAAICRFSNSDGAYTSLADQRAWGQKGMIMRLGLAPLAHRWYQGPANSRRPRQVPALP